VSSRCGCSTRPRHGRIGYSPLPSGRLQRRARAPQSHTCHTIRARSDTGGRRGPPQSAFVEGTRQLATKLRGAKRFCSTNDHAKSRPRPSRSSVGQQCNDQALRNHQAVILPIWRSPTSLFFSCFDTNAACVVLRDGAGAHDSTAPCNSAKLTEIDFPNCICRARSFALKRRVVKPNGRFDLDPDRQVSTADRPFFTPLEPVGRSATVSY
jgi:hypothetical protein